jgi:NADPH2:quinone reductase
MQAITIREHGGPDVLRLEEVPTPEPGPGEVRVRVAAIGVNFIDTYYRTGAYPAKPPFTPGNEAAGVVDAVGAGVRGLAKGDRVAFANESATYAEAVVGKPDGMVKVPEGTDLKLAAAVMLQGMTAHYLAHDTFPLGKGHVALVLAAAGGVGRLLVQIAKMRGARVLAATSSEEKAALARSAGADEIIFYRSADLAAEARRLTNGRGVDVVYDSVGKDTFEKSLDSLRPRGMMVLYGQSSGAVPPQDPQILNRKGSLFLTRPRLAHYTADRAELEKRASDLFRWIESGELDVRIDKTYPLADAAEAHRYLEAGRTRGKIILMP